MEQNFCTVAAVFDQIESLESRNQITMALAKLFLTTNPEEAKMLAYLACGSLAPQHQSLVFGLAEKQLFKAIDGLIEPKLRPSWLQLFTQHGDLGLAFVELQKTALVCSTKIGLDCQDPAVLTLGQLFLSLRQLALIQGDGSIWLKQQALTALLQQLCPVGSKFVLKIIVGKLRLGFSEMTILDALSWALVGSKQAKEVLENGYNVCADIGLIASKLFSQGLSQIENLGPVPGIPIRPSAAERMESTEQIAEKLGHFVAQPKLDGLRIQIHRFFNAGKPEIRLFSRNLLDVTEMFPELVLAGQNLGESSLAGLDFIAEGEAIAFDLEAQRFLPFQETSTRRRKHSVNEAQQKTPLRLYLFDLLFLSPEGSLLNLPHEMRRQKLLQLCPELNSQTTIQTLPEQEFFEPDASLRAIKLEDYFEQLIEAGLEGLIAKRPDAVYRAGKRNFNWIKLKRLDKTHLHDTIDCVILGYYFGKGRRAAFGIGALLAGIYSPASDGFASVCKIGTGLSDQDWVTIKAACDQHKIAQKPAGVMVAEQLTPDVWTVPNIVVSVRADQISKSPLHQAGQTILGYGLALRFPRLMAIRSDKSACDATTEQELVDLAKIQLSGSHD